MADATNLDALEQTVGELKTNRCKQRLKIFSDYKEAFGNRFDDLEFLDYTTGGVVKGVELRDVQSGCEIYERLGWDRAVHNEEGFHKCGCKPFDEQLHFVSEEGKPLSNTDYVVTLGDGRTVSGTTDDEGKTKRIKSANREQAIEKIEFIASDRIQPLCPKNRVQPGKCIKTISHPGVATNRVNVGTSVKTVTVQGNARKLTPGEVKMLRPIFKDSIFYTEVYIHREAFLPFGLQNKLTGMSPNGKLYCPDMTTFREDFSAASVTHKDKIWFVHEMAHVWQWNRGYRGRLVAKGALYGIATGIFGERWVYGYDTTEKNKTLPDYNMEQQAEIISHYYGGKFLKDAGCFSKLPFLEQVLADFLREPRAVDLLPGGKYRDY